MKKICLLCLLLAFCLFVFGIKDVGAQRKVMELRYQSAYPPGDVTYDILARTLIELMERVSGDEVKIKLFAPGSLVSVKDMVNALSEGLIDMAVVYGGMFAGTIPVADLEGGVPFSRSSVSQYIEMMWGPKYRLMDVVREGYAKKNIHVITPQGAGDYLFMLNFPIQKFADLKGHKIRGAGAPAMWLRAVGAAPTTFPGSEIYMAMKLGTVEGILFPAMILENLKMKEVVKYIVSPPMHSPAGVITLMNKDVWNKLPPKLREGLTERTLVNYYRYATELYFEQDAMALEAAYKYGVKKIVLPAEEKVKAIKIAVPVWDQVAKEGDAFTKKGIEIIKRYHADIGDLK